MASVKLLARDLESLNRLVEPPPAVTERIPLKKYYESAETLLLHVRDSLLSFIYLITAAFLRICRGRTMNLDPPVLIFSSSATFLSAIC